METVYYTLTARGVAVEGGLEQAAGGTRRVLLTRTPGGVRRTGGDNVVDLTAWRRAQAERARRETDAPEGFAGPEEPEASRGTEGARIRGRDRQALSRSERWAEKLLPAGEAAATLGVLAVALLLLARFLAF